MALRPGDFDPERAAAAIAGGAAVLKKQQTTVPPTHEPRGGRLMTKGRRLLFTLYLLAVMTTCLFPPWAVEKNTANVRYSSPAEYRFIGDPPYTGRYEGASVDAARLFLTLAAISAAAGVVVLWLAKSPGLPGRQRKDDDKAAAGSLSPLLDPIPMAENEPPHDHSLRNPLAALANVHDRLAEDEPDNLLRAHCRRIASKIRELAQKEPPPWQ